MRCKIANWALRVRDFIGNNGFLLENYFYFKNNHGESKINGSKSISGKKLIIQNDISQLKMKCVKNRFFFAEKNRPSKFTMLNRLQ